MDKKEIEKLAKLSRIEMKEEELELLRGDLKKILDYVSEISTARVPDTGGGGAHKKRNIMRDDTNPHEGSLYTESITKAFPRTHKGYLVVPKIISTD